MYLYYMQATIHRDQYKFIRAGQIFWLIDADWKLKGYAFADEMEVYKVNFQEIGTIVKCPNGSYKAEVRVYPKTLYARILIKGGATKEEALGAVFEAYRDMKTQDAELQDPAKELAWLESHFDDTYSFSDDYRYWAAGQVKQKRIQELRKILNICS